MTVEDANKNLPWVEKYRPSKLEDLVSHDDIIKTISQFMKENQLPHLLFYGPPGTGKTSTILACAKQMYTPQQFNSMVLELNASDDRGIGIVRGQILSFASTRTIFKAGPKLIILDEADAMTNDAQNALRRILLNMSDDEECQSQKIKITVVGEPSTGKIVLFVYDLTNLLSFEKLKVWFKSVKDILEKETKTPLMAVFGNKSDLEHQRAVRLSCVKTLTSEYLLKNYKGSARTGEMVDHAFTSLIASALGLKIPKLPVGETNSENYQVKQQSIGLPQTLEGVPTSNLIMNRKTLRKIHRGAPSSVFIEKYTDNVRFCIICNYLGKIIQALQSRCTRFRFAPLQQSQIVPRLQDIAAKENVKISEDGTKALLVLSGGDMRKVLNTLQSTWLAYRDVTEDNVYTCVGHPLRSDIDRILNWLMNENDFAACFKHIQDLKILKGLALGDILTEIHTKIQRVKFPPDVLVSLLIKMADSEARLASGCSERIELAALIAAFQLAREQIDINALSSS